MTDCDSLGVVLTPSILSSIFLILYHIPYSPQITRPMGSLVLKSTVSLKDPDMPGWSEIANDIVVNEKVGCTGLMV